MLSTSAALQGIVRWCFSRIEYLLPIGVIALVMVAYWFDGSAAQKDQQRLAKWNAMLTDTDEQIQLIHYSQDNRGMYLRFRYSDGHDFSREPVRQNRHRLQAHYRWQLVENICRAKPLIARLRRGQIINVDVWDGDWVGGVNQFLNLHIDYDRCPH